MTVQVWLKGEHGSIECVKFHGVTAIEFKELLFLHTDHGIVPFAEGSWITAIPEGVEIGEES